MSIQYATEMQDTYKSEHARSQMRHEFDMVDYFLPLQNLAIFYKLNQMYQESAACFIQLYNISKEFYDDTIFIWSLLQASLCFKKSALDDDYKWCLKEIDSYFVGNKPYFEYICSTVKE